jgi:serine/threonine protein kinase
MAPEIIMEKPYAYEADIWSLGCIIFELVSGTKPYCDMNALNVNYFILFKRPWLKWLSIHHL